MVSPKGSIFFCSYRLTTVMVRNTITIVVIILDTVDTEADLY
jgi:hypothetical protein